MLGLELVNLLGAMAPFRAAAVYVALIVLMAVGLTYLVIFQRRTKLIGLGDGGDKQLTRAIRVHGNFSENAPLALGLLILMPVVGVGALLIHLVGVLFLAGRAAHAVGLWRSTGKSMGRVIGMVVTHSALFIGALTLLWRAVSAG